MTTTANRPRLRRRVIRATFAVRDGHALTYSRVGPVEDGADLTTSQESGTDDLFDASSALLAEKGPLRRPAAGAEAAPGCATKGNSRNGTSRKRVPADVGAGNIEVPRDRNGSFGRAVAPRHARASGTRNRTQCKGNRQPTPGRSSSARRGPPAHPKKLNRT
ncbi:transposase [Streptomyces sp. NBC_00009]